MRKSQKGAIGKQRAHMHRVYQRAKANEIAMRTLLPNDAAIERPTFVVSDQSISPSFPTPRQHLSSLTPHLTLVLPPLAHPDIKRPPLIQGSDSKLPSLGKNPEFRDPNFNTPPKYTIRRKDTQLEFPEPNSKSGVIQRKGSFHPLSVKVTASKESDLPTNVKPPSKPVYVPLTMSELAETSPIKVSQ